MKEEGQPDTLESAIEKLLYLNNQGINAVEVVPVMEFSGDFSWGYNPSHPFAVESIYGGPDAFKFGRCCCFFFARYPDDS